MFHKRCDQYFDGFTKANRMEMNKGIIRIMEEYVNEWEMRKKSHKDVLSILYKKSFKFLMKHFTNFTFDVFYIYFNEMANTLIGEIKLNKKICRILIYAEIAIFIGWIFLGYFFMIKGLKKTFGRFHQMMIIYPIDDIKNNSWMKNSFKKFRKNFFYI